MGRIIFSVLIIFICSCDTPVEQSNRQTALTNPKNLEPGIYTLEAEIKLNRVRREGSFKEKYTIYNLVALVGEGTNEEKINLGLAVSGVTSSPQFYIDYDGDGNIDLDAMYEYVAMIPFGGLIARTLSEGNSQATYNTFLDHASSAQFTSINEISEKGNQLSNSLLKFVEENSQKIRDWIRSRK